MTIKRREFVTLLAGGVGAIWTASDLLAAPTTTISLVPKATTGSVRRLTAVVEVEGQLRLNADGKKVTTAPLTVLAKFEFDEKMLAATAGQPSRVVRHYSQAEADIRVERQQIKNTLRDDVRLITVERGSESTTLYSPLGPLVRDELELLRFPGEPVVWNALLPPQPVKPGDSWKVSDNTLAMLLGIDVVTSSELSASFVKQEGTLAMLELSGTVSGAVAGVATELEIKAKINFDQKPKQIVWVAMSLKEKRAIGHAQPGFETTTRVRIAAAPLTSSGYLTDKVLKDVKLSLQAGSTLLTHDSKEGGFQLLHDRRWHVMTDHREATVLRLIDNGDLIAQCNVSRLPNLPAGKQLAMDAYQQEVVTAIGKNFAQIVTGDTAKTDTGLRQLRVVAAGTADDVPVQWVYYHLADDQGRAAALVYTMDARLTQRFAELDRAMVDSLLLRPRPIDEQPAKDPAEQPQEAPAEPVAAKPSAAKK